jgi:hypothetical protein
MERIINNRLLNYVELSKLISKKQHGFIRKRSTCNLVQLFSEACMIGAWIYTKPYFNWCCLQRSFTKRVAGLWAVPDTTRLVVLNLQTLEFRRVFCDLVLLHSKTKSDLSNIFQLNSNLITRGHIVKLYKCHRSLDCAKYYFSNRVTTLWNKLPPKVV